MDSELRTFYPGKKGATPAGWLVSLLWILLAGTLRADQYGDYTFYDNGTSITIERYATSAAGPAIIPESINGKPVTSINSRAFENCTPMTSVELPPGVTMINEWTFSGCTGLTTISFPPSITSISNFAFAGCTSLTGVSIPESVTNLEPRAFFHCIKLASLSVDGANTNYSSWDGVLFNKSKTTLLLYPLDKSGVYVIPEGVTGIGDYAFNQCGGLTGITIPSGVATIGTQAFQWCQSLAALDLPPSITSIGVEAFSGCTGLSSLTIPPGVTYIGNAAFSSCTSLADVTISTGITSIGNSMFLNCGKLTNITLPQGVTAIGNSAFQSCTKLAGITLPSSITSIGNSAFSNCTSLTYIQLPAGLSGIGSQVFNNCTSLSGVDIPHGIPYIGDYMFSYCSRLTQLTIPSTVTRLGYGPFSNCPLLTAIFFQGGPPLIAQYTFNYSDSVTVYYLPGTGVWGTIYADRPTSMVTQPLKIFQISNGLPQDGTHDFLAPAGDGVPNICKYAFNMIGNEPGQQPTLEIPNNQRITLSGSAGLPLPEIHAEDGTRLQWTFIRRKASTSPGISYHVEFCNDLANDSWATNPSAEEMVVNLDGSDFERVTVTDSVAHANRRFSRIRITLP